jgi:predicted MFS family arabinose efflux permease
MSHSTATPPPTEAAPARPAESAWAPLRERAFLVVWLATLVSNIGTWMRDVGAGWLMTSLTDSAIQVALVQVATTLPIFLLSLPAGALADILDRRRVLLAVNLLLAVLAAALGVLALLDRMTPLLLIGLLFVGGCATALLQPMQQSLTPLLVPRAQLRPAVALNSLGVNIARAIGPALAGALIVLVGAWAAFFVDAASYLATLLAFWWWKGASARAAQGAPEHLAPAMRAGLRYAWHAPDLKVVLLRAASFFLFASAYWALLPVLARRVLGGDAGYYGLLLACVGAGAVLGALVLPRLRQRLGAEGVLRAGIVLSIVVLVLLAAVQHRTVAAAAMTVAGLAWIAVLTTANVAAQTALPNWVRGRGLALYLTVFYGAMTAGSFLWGAMADALGVPAALLGAAGLGVVALLIGWLRPLPARELDLTPSMHWPEPALSRDMIASLQDDRGPVMVTVEYTVRGEDRGAFLQALHLLREQRLRDGAFQWGVFEDAATTGRFLECFQVESWLEHERQHHRVSRADADLQQAVRRFHAGSDAPRVQHFIAPPATERRG